MFPLCFAWKALLTRNMRLYILTYQIVSEKKIVYSTNWRFQVLQISIKTDKDLLPQKWASFLWRKSIRHQATSLSLFDQVISKCPATLAQLEKQLMETLSIFQQRFVFVEIIFVAKFGLSKIVALYWHNFLTCVRATQMLIGRTDMAFLGSRIWSKRKGGHHEVVKCPKCHEHN